MLLESLVSLLPSSFTVLSTYSLNADQNENVNGNTVQLLLLSLGIDFLARVEPEGSSLCVQMLVT